MIGERGGWSGRAGEAATRGGWFSIAILAAGIVSPFGLAWVRQDGRASTRLTAARPVAGDAGLFVVGADGEGLRAVAAPVDFARAAFPDWSPDGARIAFTAFDRSGRTPEVRVVALADGGLVALGRGVAPSWSRDGSRVAAMVSGKADIATDWSRPGNNSERIVVLRADRPASEPVESLGEGLWPRFAPTDDRLAFATRTHSSWDIYVRSADRLSLTRITDSPSQDTSPIWTADGVYLVFLSNRNNRWDLYRTAADGRGMPERLTTLSMREENAALSPDGSRLAFTDALGRRTARIMLFELGTRTPTELLSEAVDDREPAWSPDGRLIAFSSRRPVAGP